jgi:hypothetical protein
VVEAHVCGNRNRLEVSGRTIDRQLAVVEEEVRMRRWLYRLRGLLGLGALGGVLGGLIGAGWVVIEMLSGGPSMFRLSFAAMSTIWGIVGATTGVGFGLLLTATSAGRRLEEVTNRRAALLGGVAGAACPIIVGTLMAGSLPPLGLGLWLAGIGGLGGAGVAVGVIGIAKRAERREELQATGPKTLIG